MAYAAFIRTAPIPNGMIEALWESESQPENSTHILFDPQSLAFVFVRREFIRILDTQGICSTSRPPFEVAQDHIGPAETDGFDYDLDRYTTFFAVRHFTRDTPGVTLVTREPSGVYTIQTEFFQASRQLSFTIDWAKHGNKTMRRDWIIGQDSSVLEIRFDGSAEGVPVVYAEKAPAHSWLIDSPSMPLKLARVVPRDASLFTLAHARGLLTGLSRTTERRVVYRKDGASTGGSHAPGSSAEQGSVKIDTGAGVTWTWPLFFSGVVVLIAGWVAKRRQA
jgi:hypothetical protein